APVRGPGLGLGLGWLRRVAPARRVAVLGLVLAGLVSRIRRLACPIRRLAVLVRRLAFLGLLRRGRLARGRRLTLLYRLALLRGVALLRDQVRVRDPERLPQLLLRLLIQPLRVDDLADLVSGPFGAA